MLTTFVAIYTLYVFMTIYTSVMQIGHINEARKKRPILLDEEEYLNAASYAVAKEKVKVASAFVDYLFFIAWIGFGIQLLASTFFSLEGALFNVAVVMGFVLINAIVSLPFAYYEKFELDSAYGFNKSTLAQWIKDTLISFVTTMLIGSLLVWGLYLIITTFTLWWLWSFLFIFSFVILINMLYPAFRAMFFDKLTPLQDEALDASIHELMQRTGFVSSGIFVSDASKRDSRLNAYFGGFGRAKRVVLFDTLLEKLTHKELLAVLGHELGHFAHGDIYKNIAIVGAMLFALFALFGNLPSQLYLEMGLSQEPYVSIILLLLSMPVLGFIMMPLMGIISRANEYAADRMGSELGGPAGSIELASALQKLVSENRSFPHSHPIYIFFHYTHPPVLERLKALGVDIEKL